MKLIALSNGELALVDAKHYVDVLNAGPWHKSTQGYVNRTIKRNGIKTSQGLHQFIGELEGLTGELDHKNLDKLDCTTQNLRQVTRKQNMRNLPLSPRSSSKVKSVNWREDVQKYRVRIVTDEGRIDIGHFETLEEATEAYRKASEKYHGEHGRTE